MAMVMVMVDDTDVVAEVTAKLTGGWISTKDTLPPEGVVVMTKSDDSHGLRNVKELVRNNKTWWTADHDLMMYYTPTHWKRI